MGHDVVAMDSIQRGGHPRRWLVALRALTDVLANPQLRRLQLAWTGCITAEWAQIVALGVYAFREQGAIGVGVVGDPDPASGDHRTVRCEPG